jgi:hypothetical protein
MRPDAVFEKARQRTRDTTNDDARLKSGGKARYLLSGLLSCGQCGARYVLGNRASYVCAGYVGGDCTNNVWVRRDRVEKIILDPIRQELLSPEVVERMAKELRQQHAAWLNDLAGKADAAPAEVRSISERIARLRDRLAAGDPDMEPDEIQIAIDRAEQKRHELLDTQPAAKQSAKMIALLPKAAESYRRQIAQGLDNDPRAAGKARVILRKLLGNIRLIPEQSGLWAEFELQPAALLKASGSGGSGGRI